MSTQNIITLKNLPTDLAVAQFLREKSKDVLKSLRFEIGCIDHSELAEIIRLKELLCKSACYLEEGESTALRETIIKKTITKIYDI